MRRLSLFRKIIAGLAITYILAAAGVVIANGGTLIQHPATPHSPNCADDTSTSSNPLSSLPYCDYAAGPAQELNFVTWRFGSWNDHTVVYGPQEYVMSDVVIALVILACATSPAWFPATPFWRRKRLPHAKN